MFRQDEEDQYLTPGGGDELDLTDAPAHAALSSPISRLQDERDAARSQKVLLNLAGGAAQSLIDSPTAYEIYTKSRSKRPDVKGMLGGVADSIEDPMTSQEKAYAFLKAKNEGTQSQADAAYASALQKPDSKESMALKQIAPRWGVQTSPEMTGAEIQRLIDPKKMMETEAKSTVDFNKEKAIHGLDSDARLKNSLLEINARGKERALDKAGSDYDKLVQSTEQHAASLRGDDAAKLSSAKLSAIASGRALLRQYAGREDEMTPDQLSILAADRVKAVTGGVPTNEEMKAMMPHNSGTAWAGTKSYFTGKPEAANSGGWAKEAERDFAAQEKAARDILKNRQDQITSNPRLRPADKERISKMAVPPEYLSPPQGDKTIIKTQTNQKTGAKRIVYSDGTSEVLPGQTAGN